MDKKLIDTIVSVLCFVILIFWVSTLTRQHGAIAPAPLRIPEPAPAPALPFEEAPALPPKDTTAHTSLTAENVLALVNRERVSHGLKPLTEESRLTKAAQDKVTDEIAVGYFAHSSPDGKSPWYWLKQEQYRFFYAGENLARYFTTAPDTVDAWMASETHRENILNPSYTQTGVAVEGSYVVQEFGAPATP